MLPMSKGGPGVGARMLGPSARAGVWRDGMSDIGLETIGAPAVNGDRGEHSQAAEQVMTVLAKEDVLSGRLQIRGGGIVQGTFSGRIECDGDLMIGPDAHALYEWIASEAGEAATPKWNFHKYLIGKDGSLLGAWPSRVRPGSSEITGAIEKAL